MGSINQIPKEFENAVADLGIVFDDGDLHNLATYIDVLLETNRLFNLTGIKTRNWHGQNISSTVFRSFPA